MPPGPHSPVVSFCTRTRSGSHSPYYCGYPPHIENADHNAAPEQTFFNLDATLSYQVGVKL